MRKKLWFSSFLLVGSWDKGLYIVAQCSKTFDIVIIQRDFNTLLTCSVQKLRDIGTLYIVGIAIRFRRNPLVFICTFFWLGCIICLILFVLIVLTGCGFLFLLHQVFQLDIEVALCFIGYNLLHHSCPWCTIAGTFIFENTHELHTAVDGSKVVGEMERVLEIEHYGIYHRGKEYRKDEDGEIFHHLCHFLRFQFAVDFASRVFFDSLPIAGIDTAVAAPCGVTIADEGEEAHGDVIKGWFEGTPYQANDGCDEPCEGGN
nr:MAG TPA: hypothetical protein [Bacteriophage sp.]